MEDKLIAPIFCHICLSTIYEGARKFFVTDCKHVFCEICFTKDFCKICDKQCKEHPIDNTLPNNVLQYFNPYAPQQLINTAVKILEFQKKQQSIYVEKSINLREKYAASKKKIKDLLECKKQLQERITREKTFIQILKDAYHLHKRWVNKMRLKQRDVHQPMVALRSQRSSAATRASTCTYSQLARFALHSTMKITHAQN